MVACNWQNVLCGPKGVARVFGPQKGASEQEVQMLEAGLDKFAEVVERDLGINVRNISGGGASGGLGAGLHALMGATLYPRYDLVMNYFDLESLFENVDLVITAEGQIDFQTPRGKIPAEVARRAKRHRLPVLAIAGTIGKGAGINLEHGVDAYTCIMDSPRTLEEAIELTPSLLIEATERMIRTLRVGSQLL
jgi:glycerate kinase